MNSRSPPVQRPSLNSRNRSGATASAEEACGEPEAREGEECSGEAELGLVLNTAITGGRNLGVVAGPERLAGPLDWDPGLVEGAEARVDVVGVDEALVAHEHRAV